MSERCQHGSPLENCADCLIERLFAERDTAREEAALLPFVREERDGYRWERDRAIALLRECRDELAVNADPNDAEEQDRIARLNEVLR